MQPLAGIRVLDLGQIYNGPYAGLLLALAGADVVKVEPPTGEPLRRRPNLNGADYPLLVLNANKRTVALDFRKDVDREVFLRLVGVADVLIENFSPGTMHRLGLGYETLRKANPGLVYAAGSGYGSEGPYRDLLAMDLTVQAMAGVMEATGFPEQPPVKAGAALCDFLAGTHLYAGIATALVRRARTGRGGLVEVSMFEAVLPTLLSNLAPVMLGGLPGATRTGNRHGGGAEAPYNVYPTADGYVAIICVGEEHWVRLAKLMGREDLLGHPHFATRADRVAHSGEVDDLVAGWTRQRTRADLARLVSDAGVPAAPVRTLAEVASDEHLRWRGTFQKISHREHGEVTLISSPIRYDGGLAPEVRPSHGLGEDQDDVIRDWLGDAAAGGAHAG
jgi:crotonobetainyl-CoA:carnitine CoA-transferase CaiB-like acyl-CoA transferase